MAYEIPDGWRQGLPYTSVNTDVIDWLGMPTVDFTALGELYFNELAVPTKPTPILNLVLLNNPSALTPSGPALHGRYVHRFRESYVDPLSFIFSHQPNKGVVEAVAHEAKHCANRTFNEDAVRQNRGLDERQALEFAAMIRESGAYDNIIQFPRYSAPSSDSNFVLDWDAGLVRFQVLDQLPDSPPHPPIY